MSEKLQKILARLGCGSRRQMEKYIQLGLVCINGKKVVLGERVDIECSPHITVNGRIISYDKVNEESCRVLAYYKPEGELCTRDDPQGRKIVFTQLPKLQKSRWIAVGRLDINTSGLLLFTTHGELAYRLMHPKYRIEREYSVRIFGKVERQHICQLQSGIRLAEGMAAFSKIQYQGGEGTNQWYNVTLTEGRNREVRRLWEAVGLQVSRLIRIRFAEIQLCKNVPRGDWVELSPSQISSLYQSVKMNPPIKF